jgi:L-fuconolactonase
VNIDAHQHFWKYDPAAYGWIGDGMAALKRNFLPTDLEPLLAAAGFEGCVAVQARPAEEETRWLLDLAGRHPFIRGVVGWVDLCAADAGARLDRLRHPKLVGLRHLVQDEPDDAFLLRADFTRGLRALGERGLAYDLLVHPRQLPAAVELARRLPGQRFVLDHLAKPAIAHGGRAAWEPGFRALAACPNVWCKLSGLVTEADWSRWTPTDLHPFLDVALECFGPERLMIGSDWPVCLLAGGYERTMAAVTDHLDALPAAQRAAVLGGNASRFWNLE